MQSFKSIKRVISFVLAMTMVVTLAFSNTTPVYAASKAVKSVTLKIGSKNVTKKTYNLAVGKTATIKATVKPSAAKKSIAYKTSSKAIATVSKTGKVTAKKAGTAKITVTVTGKNKKKVSTYVKIKVKNVDVTDVTLNMEDVVLEIGETTILEATVNPSNATNPTISWSSNNTKVASVDASGKVTAKTTGVAVITAKSNNGKKATCKVTVEAGTVHVTGIKAVPEKTDIGVGESVAIRTTVTPSNATDNRVKYVSSDTTVAVVSETGIISGFNEGTTTITVSSVSDPGVKDSFEVKVSSVKVTKIELNKSEAELSISDTTNLTPTVYPENATDKTVTWSSDNESVAEVDMNGKVTAKAVGKARITATAKDGSGVFASCDVTVKSNSVLADGVTVEVTNPYKDKAGNEYANTVLVGDDMAVLVRVVKGGQPLGNSNVTLKLEAQYGNAANYFEIRDNYVATDENGYAKFTIGLKPSYDNTNAVSNVYQSYTVTATEASSNVEQQITVKFASVQISDLYNLNGNVISYAGTPIAGPLGDVIDPSDNASPADDGLKVTYSTNKARVEEYVSSQKVSASDGTDDNSVYFDVIPLLVLPATSETAHMGDWEVKFNSSEGTSGSYSVYNDDTNMTTTATVQNVPAGLQYITVYFSKLNLSKYTALYIDVYSQNGSILDHKERTFDSNSDGVTGDIGIQVKAQQDEKSFIVVSIVSEGQVDASNTGYVLTKMSGPWATTNDELTTLVELSGCVTWKDVTDKVSYDPYTMSYAVAQEYLPAGSEFLNPNYKYTYQIPAFPYNGNAIITVKDSNSNVKAYFTYPSVRDNDINNANVNILAAPPESTQYGAYAVQVSTEEISQRTVGKLSQNGNIAKVVATKTGFTELQAAVSVPGLDSKELNDLNGGILYTSVQWAPIPTKDSEDIIPDYYAVEGQNVNITAQLYDQNGNKKTDAGATINFFYTDALGNEIQINQNGQNIGGDEIGNDTATVVSYVQSTDVNGQVVITLTGNGVDFVEGITARAAGYKVGLTFDGSTPGTRLTDTTGNVFWVDLGLTFMDSAVKSDNPTRSTWFENSQKEIARQGSSEVGKKWDVGFVPVARSHKFNYSHEVLTESYSTYYQQLLMEYDAAVADEMAWALIHDLSSSSEFISVSGVNVDYSVGRGSNATVENRGNNVARITANIIGTSKMTGLIDANSISNNTTFRFYDEEGIPVTYRNVGVGVPTVSNTGLNYFMYWSLSGLKANIITPSGTTLDIATASKVYVEVLDNYENKAEGIPVKYSITGPNATTEVSGVTDSFGIYEIDLPAPNASGISVISIVVGDDIRKSVSITYSDTRAPKFGIALDDATTNAYAVEVVGSDKMVVYFNNQINSDTIMAGEFEFVENNNNTVSYTVVSAVKGKTNDSVVLTLDKAIVNPEAIHTLTVSDYTAANGVVYSLMDNNGQKISNAPVENVNQGKRYVFKPSERIN